MKGVYIQNNSPYYWLRYYDKLEHNPTRKRKSVNTKIKVTPSDKQKLAGRKTGEKLELQGTPELRKLLKSFKVGLAERDIQARSGVKLRKDLKLSEGYQEFKQARSVPGSKRELKLKTFENYNIAVDHMIASCGDKKIYKYTAQRDYVDLLNYFENRKIGGKKIKNKEGKDETIYKSMSINTRSIYTRSLRTLWKYFVEQNHAAVNIIEPVEAEDKDPEPIPIGEVYTILNQFDDDDEYPHHFWIIAFMLLTGCRPSSAIVQRKEDINFKSKVITIRNVKSGKRKKKEYYKFPLYWALEDLIKSMGVKQGDTGRLFDMYSVVPANYTWPLSFWKRKVHFLKLGKYISDEYTLKQLRPTFISFLINVLKMDIYTVYKLADHANIKVTDKHYVSFKLDNARDELNEITLDSFLSGRIL
ncbi:MAG: tyrosine-type recombinase/integrase [Bacteroidetes bacterium]|nr:tyrosine-type recombinase/integrase [Bacteroidota bacterium]